MFNINLLNKPGEQKKDTKDDSISFNSEFSNNDIEINRANKESPSDTSSEDKKNIDLFSIIIIFLIIGIIVSIFLGYYFEKL